MAVGLITKSNQAHSIVANGEADLIALARGMLYDPRWGWHAAAELGATVTAPPPYWRAPPHEHKDLFYTTVESACGKGAQPARGACLPNGRHVCPAP